MMPTHMSRIGRQLRATVTATNNRKSLRLRTTFLEMADQQTVPIHCCALLSSRVSSASKGESPMMPTHMSRAGRKLRTRVTATNNRKSLRLRTTFLEMAGQQTVPIRCCALLSSRVSSATMGEPAMTATHMSRAGRKLRARVTATNNRKSLRLRTTFLEMAGQQTVPNRCCALLSSCVSSASKGESPMMPTHMSRIDRKLRTRVTATNNRKSLRLRTTLIDTAVPETARGGSRGRRSFRQLFCPLGKTLRPPAGVFTEAEQDLVGVAPTSYRRSLIAGSSVKASGRVGSVA
jgi:hypothetical protein